MYLTQSCLVTDEDFASAVDSRIDFYNGRVLQILIIQTYKQTCIRI